MSGLTGEESGIAPDEGVESAATTPRLTRRDRVQLWFAALLRAAIALVSTLAVLALLGGVTDVVLHETRHTSSNSTSYSRITGVQVVLDGDISLTVLGKTQSGYGATLSAVDTSTPFDDPIRSADVIGGTLYLTESCPDSRCTAQLTLTVNSAADVDIVSGNALRLNDAVIDLDGIAGPVSVQADPAKLVVTNSVVSGAVVGDVLCDSSTDCLNVASSSNSTSSSG